MGQRAAANQAIAYDPIDTDYILLVNRYGLKRISEIWPAALNEPLPLIPVPLLPPDPDVPLDLNAAIREVLGSVPSSAVLSEDRTGLMNRIRDLARREAAARRSSRLRAGASSLPT